MIFWTTPVYTKLVITREPTQPAITCSKLTIETLEHGLKFYSMFKFYSRNTRKGCEICSKLTIKTPFSNVSIADFE